MRLATRVLVVVIGLCVLPLPREVPALAPAPVAAQGEAAASPAQQLADRYAPISFPRRQPTACARPPRGGEPYLPLPVEMVLDNPAVHLRDSATGDILATGLSAPELATYGPDTYLDFPGDPLRPGCVYETDERARIATLGLEPTVYARVAFDADDQRLALQYWFFYYYNDWNNTHEGDWESIQLMWDDVASVDEALTMLPSRTGFSQHGGGELADWGDAKIELEGDTHPVVYPAAGAHATFYSNSVYLAWGENGSGFGCDYSSPRSVRTPLTAVLVPDNPDPTGPFAWLLWEGRWGERKPSMFNGPVGPALNGRWLDPWETTDTWRTYSIVVPESNAFGPTMTDAFCTVTSGSSRLLISIVLYPWVIIPAITVVVGALWFFFRRSRDLFRRAGRLYLAHWRVFVGIGLIAIPIGIVFNALQIFLVERQPLRDVVYWFDNTAGARLSAVALVGGLQQAAMLLLIAPTVIQAVADIHRGRTPGVVRSYRLATERLWAIALAASIILLLVALPILILIGIPIAIWLLVRWQFFAQALIFGRERSSVDALRESARLVRRRWWITLFTVLIFNLLATIPVLVVGFSLLALGNTAVGFANGISSLLYALTIPVAVIAVTLLFLDRSGIPGAEPAAAPAQP